MTTPIRLFSLALLLILGAGQQQSYATVISLNLGSNVNGSTAVGSQTAGVVSVGNWNDIPLAQQTLLPLNNSSGSASGAKLTTAETFVVSPSATAASGVSFPNPGDTAMMTGHIYHGGGSPVDLTINSVPYASYDLYIYYNSSAVTNLQTFSLLTTPGLAATGFVAHGFETPGADTAFVLSNNSTSTPNNANYAVIHGVNLADFVLRAQGLNNDSNQYGYINGLQLVEVPEPSTWCLLGFGAVAFGAIARRRRRQA